MIWIKSQAEASSLRAQRSMTLSWRQIHAQRAAPNEGANCTDVNCSLSKLARLKEIATSLSFLAMTLSLTCDVHRQPTQTSTSLREQRSNLVQPARLMPMATSLSLLADDVNRAGNSGAICISIEDSDPSTGALNARYEKSPGRSPALLPVCVSTSACSRRGRVRRTASANG